MYVSPFANLMCASRSLRASVFLSLWLSTLRIRHAVQTLNEWKQRNCFTVFVLQESRENEKFLILFFLFCASSFPFRRSTISNLFVCVSLVAVVASVASLNGCIFKCDYIDFALGLFSSSAPASIWLCVLACACANNMCNNALPHYQHLNATTKLTTAPWTGEKTKLFVLFFGWCARVSLLSLSFSFSLFSQNIVISFSPLFNLHNVITTCFHIFFTIFYFLFSLPFTFASSPFGVTQYASIFAYTRWWCRQVWSVAFVAVFIECTTTKSNDAQKLLHFIVVNSRSSKLNIFK